jgi:hypothetical protein
MDNQWSSMLNMLPPVLLFLSVAFNIALLLAVFVGVRELKAIRKLLHGLRPTNEDEDAIGRG